MELISTQQKQIFPSVSRGEAALSKTLTQQHADLSLVNTLKLDSHDWSAAFLGSFLHPDKGLLHIL